MPEKIKLGIVAAMQREIGPLVRGWKVESVPAKAGQAKAFSGPDAVLMCAGIGDAAPVTKMLIESYRPEIVISVGFAGSLSEELRVPAVFVPTRVVDERSGAEFQTGAGSGSLVTVAQIADVNRKHELAKRFSAEAVDMEASQVAKEAEKSGRRFLAIKAISDDADSDISFVSDFTRSSGFDTAGFLAHVAVRPRLWGAVRDLHANSSRAQHVLCSYLKFIIQNTSRIDFALAQKDVYGAVAPANQ